MTFLVAPGVLMCGIVAMHGFVAVYGIVVVCGLAAVHGIGVKQIFIMVFSFASFVLTFLVSLVTSFSSSSS